MTDHSAVAVQQNTPVLSGEMSVQEALARFAKIEQLTEKVLKEGKAAGTGDFGIFPGTKQKVLFKSGAEKLCTVFRLGAFYTVEKESRDGDHVSYTIRCTLRHQPTGAEVGSALGFCSTKESKYRYRNSGRKCPTCGLESIIKGKAEYGGGWLCFAKRGGCGAKFKDGDASIEDQDVGKIENPDLADVENTVMKMGEKRAHVAATLNALGISSLFTQDIVEDESESRTQRRSAPPEEPASDNSPPGWGDGMDPYEKAVVQLEEAHENGGVGALAETWERNAASWKGNFTKGQFVKLTGIKDTLKGKGGASEPA